VLNVSLNATCLVLLLTGYTLIRKKRIVAHKRCMTAAAVAAGLFLTSYVVYHINVGSVKFKPTGMVHTIYISILITHVLMAASIAVLVPMTLYRAYTNQVERHMRIAKITFPIWLYVSITGIVVYTMLYVIWPSA